MSSEAQPASVADLLALGAARTPDRPLLTFPGAAGGAADDGAGRRELTWAELDAEVDRVATGLGDAGLVAGYRVMVVMTNRVELVVTYLALLRAQVVAVPVDPRLPADELARRLRSTGARLVVADGPSADAVREAVAALADPADTAPRVVVVGEESYEQLRATGVRRALPVRDPEALSVLLHTGDAGGEAVAAMLTHRAQLANLRQVGAVDPPLMRADDVVLGVLPLFHVYGLNAVLGGVLHAGARLVLATAGEPREMLELVRREAVTVVPVAPAVFRHWLAQPDLAELMAGVHAVVSGSSTVPPPVVAEFTDRTGLPVHQGYGLTEAAPVVTSTLVRPPDDAAASARQDDGLGGGLDDGGSAWSVGTPVPGVELRIVDDAGGPAAPGDPGHIEIRGDNLFSGYWPDGHDGPGDDGWWSTGDVGLLDGAGGLQLVDRASETLTVSGFTVYPVEIEQVLREVPGVAESAVIGVDGDDGRTAVVAYLRPDDAALLDDAGARDDLVQRAEVHAAAALAPFKRPTRLEVVATLPRTSTGKVRKGRLRVLERRRALELLE